MKTSIFKKRKVIGFFCVKLLFVFFISQSLLCEQVDIAKIDTREQVQKQLKEEMLRDLDHIHRMFNLEY